MNEAAREDMRLDVADPASTDFAMRQVARLVKQTCGLEVEVGADGSSFAASRRKEHSAPGVLSASGSRMDDSRISVRIEMAEVQRNVRVCLGPIVDKLAALSDKAHLLAPGGTQVPGEHSLWVELKVQGSPLSMARSTALADELVRINELAMTIQGELPSLMDEPALAKLYEPFSGILAPVQPLDDLTGVPKAVQEWVDDTLDLLGACATVAVAAPCQVLEGFALAALARGCMAQGGSVARLSRPMISPRDLVELTEKVPGILAVPALSLNMGTSLYEIGGEVHAMLACVSSAGRPLIFTGTFERLQSAFHGGQGGTSDPLLPVVLHAPEVPFEMLARFAVRGAGRAAGGIPRSAEDTLTSQTLEALTGRTAAEQKRVLPIVSRRIVSAWARGGSGPSSSAAQFTLKVAGRSETLAGLSAKPRVCRSAQVQEHSVRVLTDAGLLPYFQEHLLAQEAALGEVVARLRAECLTRPLHQPYRYCAQGTPATGKSETAILLARRLGIPYVNIDAASIPDYYTAASQLLGSARGIVGSYQSGRLEQAAKHHAGVVVEVSDLDHASASVRSALADLFLQVLETGEAQSGTGAMFSCANLILIFTMNLPDGMDEAVRNSVGFNCAPSRAAVTESVAWEIKSLLSSAFLSRVGTPVLFEPLDAQAANTILERAVAAAVLAAMERLGLPSAEVHLDDGLGAALRSVLKAHITSYGARALLEHGRSLAAQAVTVFAAGNASGRADRLLVALEPSGALVIRPL